MPYCRLIWWHSTVWLEGLKFSLVPRRQQLHTAPKFEKYSFVLNSADKISSPSIDVGFEHFHCLSTNCFENSAGAAKVKFVEYGADKTFEEIYMPNIVNILKC